MTPDLRKAAEAALEALGDAWGAINQLERHTAAREWIVGIMNKISAAEAALSAALEGEGWRPIESAPRDGTRVLTWSERDGISINSQHRGDFAAGSRDGMPTNGHEFAGNPTAWMPLPTPPKE